MKLIWLQQAKLFNSDQLNYNKKYKKLMLRAHLSVKEKALNYPLFIHLQSNKLKKKNPLLK
jgi:hypothetical protein